MVSPSAVDSRSNFELRSLMEIACLPRPHMHLRDYFQTVMAILSEYFSTEYSALVLQDPKKEVLQVEAHYGMGRDIHPVSCGRRGIIARVLDSRQPAVIQNLSQEPLYEEVMKDTRTEKIRPPLLCVPIVVDEEPIGVININALYGSKNEFVEDFQFLSVLSAILSPVIKDYQVKREAPSPRPAKLKAKPSFLDEILQEKLTEVLNKIDPYVESKARMGIFNDIIEVVEKIVIKSALERMGHVQTATAQFLGINRNTLRKKMKELKIKSR